MIFPDFKRLGFLFPDGEDKDGEDKDGEDNCWLTAMQTMLMKEVTAKALGIPFGTRDYRQIQAAIERRFFPGQAVKSQLSTSHAANARQTAMQSQAAHTGSTGDNHYAINGSRLSDASKKEFRISSNSMHGFLNLPSLPPAGLFQPPTGPITWPQGVERSNPSERTVTVRNPRKRRSGESGRNNVNSKRPRTDALNPLRDITSISNIPAKPRQEVFVEIVVNSKMRRRD
jgi:hypothetical protein